MHSSLEYCDTRETFKPMQDIGIPSEYVELSRLQEKNLNPIQAKRSEG